VLSADGTREFFPIAMRARKRLSFVESADVGSGSKASIPLGLAKVRFTPNSDQ
jgi:hypothetical protein